MADKILVIDCGSQYSHLITREIRRLGVFSELVPAGSFNEKFVKEDVKGVIISGGPDSVYNKEAPKPSVKNINVPLLGICYGHHYLAHIMKGDVRKGKAEYGKAVIEVKNNSALMKGLSKKESVWMSHGDEVYSLPKEFKILAESDGCIAAFANEGKNIYGLQFHPEVAHTRNGKKVMKNFVFDICRCKKGWDMGDFIQKSIKEIEEHCKGKKAIVCLSGGIDSSTAAFLSAKALGKDLTAVYVDTGLMREGETEEVKELFRNSGLKLIVLHEEERFYKVLKGITDPEKKRRIIGQLFWDIFKEKLKEIKADYIIQGTIYPDRIESAQSSKHASRIKTHHNVAIKDIEEWRRQGKVIEPLQDLYKDEVREIARRMKMPMKMVERQPFPGPGLAARIEGEVTKEKAGIVRKADKIFREEIDKLPKNRRPTWQYFAVLSNAKATGVKGDARAYGHVIVLRAVDSKETMTANVTKLSHEFLENVATRIANTIPEVTRVVYDYTSKPPSTIEWE